MINNMNTFELSDEQLAEVTGGSRTDFSQLAHAFTHQNNSVNGKTTVFAIGGGRNSTTEALGQGSSNNLTNLSITSNGNSIG